MRLTKKEIADQLQFAEFERDEYNKLVHWKIIPSLDITPEEIDHLDIDMYQTVICKKICDMKVENVRLKKYEKMINDLESKYIVIFRGDDGCDMKIGDVELIKEKFAEVVKSVDECDKLL
jgi:hypothetical protein